MDTSSTPTLLGRFDSFEVIDDLNQAAVDDTGNSNTVIEKQKNDSGSKVSPPDERGRSVRPTYTRMSRRWLSPSVLNRYKIEYIFENENPDFIVIKRWVPEYEQDFLWTATKEDRAKREKKRQEFERRRIEGSDEITGKAGGGKGKVEGEAKVLMVSRGKRGEDLRLEINHMPMRKWRRKFRGNHVLDVAMEPPHPTGTTVDPEDSAIEDGSAPVRLAINSSHVAQELSRIADINFHSGDVIIPPWKPLVVHHEAIIQRFQDLNELQRERNATKPENEEADLTPAGKEDSSDTKSSDKPKVDINVEQNKPAPITAPCKVCELVYPPHDTPLECLDIQISHLKCLVDFLNDYLEPVISLRRDLASTAAKEIEFSDLYHLFNPGDVIFSPNYRQAYRVFHTSGGRPLLSKPVGFYKRPAVTPFRIDCFYIDFDRTTLGPVYEMISIAPFDGKRLVTSLVTEFGRVPVFPIRFLDDWEKIKEELVQRGRRLKGVGPLAHKRYHGTTVTNTGLIYQPHEFITDKRWDVDRRRRHILPFLEGTPDYITSDIMIDFEKEGKFIDTQLPMIQGDWRETAEGCRHYGPTNFIPLAEMAFQSDCDCSDIFPDNNVDKRRAETCKKDADLLKVQHPDDILTDEHFMLLPSIITGFVLEKKAWMELFVDRILDLEWEKEATTGVLKRKRGVDDLIIPEGYSDLLEGLISAQHSTRIPRGVVSPAKADSIEAINRGAQGLTILLHGNSGNGKSSTAEAIATFTHKPLYSIPLNKVLLDAIGMGEYLESHLSRAQDWNCITLLSDVDSKISKTSPKNNDPTTLCQIIDNHRGILIITAKKASSIHQEILSRIHVSLHFPCFDQNVALEVWGKNLDTLKDSGVVNVEEKTKEEILVFAESEYVRGARWDGRQIQNCLQTAATLAKYSAGKQSSEVQGSASLTLKAVETAAKSMGSLIIMVKSE
ncbi:hypothetical protein B0J14DRAFT_579960 [Halenospora varia]|nr:hypothetical protein B0J14DRAFT_579960 [Halenospora varia]